MVSALGPRVKYMDPIKVFTGGADKQKPDLVEGMLLPRPRPDPATLPKPVAMPDDMPGTLRPAFDNYFE